MNWPYLHVVPAKWVECRFSYEVWVRRHCLKAYQDSIIQCARDNGHMICANECSYD